MEAIVFIGHGSRSPQGNVVFLKFIKETMSGVHAPIKEYCFFERAEPTLSEAIDNCVRKGGTEIVVVPVLLLPGIQSNIEIPEELRLAKEKYPEVTIKYGAPIGADTVMSEIIEQRLGEMSSNEDVILLVSHGSHDPQAAEEFRSLADWLSEKRDMQVEISFLTSEPFYHEKASKLAQSSKKVFVIPYLLFTGAFQEKMQEAIAGHGKIILCEEIGYDDRLKLLLAERGVMTRENPVLTI